MEKAQEKGGGNSEVIRVTLRLSPEEHEKLKYWAGHHEMTVNDFVDYELPTLEVQRLNQLIESQAALVKEVQSLQGMITNYFSDLLKLTHGDNYLLESDETGEF